MQPHLEIVYIIKVVSEITEAKRDFLTSVAANNFNTPNTRIISKRIKDINRKTKTIPVLKGNVGDFLYNLSVGKDFITMIQKYKYIEKKRMGKIYHANNNHKKVELEIDTNLRQSRL